MALKCSAVPRAPLGGCLTLGMSNSSQTNVTAAPIVPQATQGNISARIGRDSTVRGDTSMTRLWWATLRRMHSQSLAEDNECVLEA